MLLRSMISDEEGRLTGISEMGKRVTLSCPHPHSFLGRGNYSESLERLGESILQRHLADRAREDSDRYYFIGEPEYAEERNLCIIPYLTFEK